MDWQNRRLQWDDDEAGDREDGLDSLLVSLEGMGDEDHGVRLYVPADYDEARAFLERLCAAYNATLEA